MSHDTHRTQFELRRQGPWSGGPPAPLQALIATRSIVRFDCKEAFLAREGAPAKGLFAVLEGRTAWRAVRAGLAKC